MANPAGTNYQANTVTSGSRALSTGSAAGAYHGANDLDGGSTSVRSVEIKLPSTVGRLTFRYYLAHGSTSSSADKFEAFVEEQDGTRTLVRSEVGAADIDRPSWASASIALTPWAGQTIRIVFVATDGANESIVEAAVDDVRVTRP